MSVAAAGTRGDAPLSDQLLYNHTWCHPHLYISTFLGCVCSVPFSCGVCSGISIQSMCLMHHLLDTHLGFVVACGVQIAGAECSNLRVDGLWISSSVACMKLFLDLRRFLGRLWPCSGCLLSFTCFSRSRWAVTLLLAAGGAIPARRYKFSTLVGCRHPVMARQASFSTGSTLCACADLSHTGHAYFAVE